jgi:hypothetical protein
MAGVNMVIFGRITQARLRQKSDEIGFVRKVKALAETIVEIKIFDEDQEVIVFTVEFSVRESQTCDPLLLGNEQIVFQSPFVFFSAEPVFFGDRIGLGRGDRSVSRNDGCCLGNDGCRILHFGMKQYLPGNEYSY